MRLGYATATKRMHASDICCVLRDNQQYCKQNPTDKACPTVNCGDLLSAAYNAQYCDTTVCKAFYDPHIPDDKRDEKLACDAVCSPSLLEGSNYKLPLLRSICEDRCKYAGIENSYICLQYCSFYPNSTVCGPNVAERYG